MIDACCDERCWGCGSVMELDAPLNRDCRAANGDRGVLRLQEDSSIYDVRRPYRKCGCGNGVTDNGCARLVRLMEERMLGRRESRRRVY